MSKIDKITIKTPLKSGQNILTSNKIKLLYPIVSGIQSVNFFILVNTLSPKQNYKREFLKITLASFCQLEIKNKTIFSLRNILILCLNLFFTPFSTLSQNQEANLTINLNKNF